MSSSLRLLKRVMMTLFILMFPVITSNAFSTSQPTQTRASIESLKTSSHSDDNVKSLSTTEFLKLKLSSTATPSATTSTKLDMVMEQRREYELNLGKALDTLRHDYPNLLREAPDFDIYHTDLEVVDPSGWELHGLKNYKRFFSVLRSIVGFLYCPESSVLTYRLVYCFARKHIRVTWNAVLVPKSIYGGRRNTVYLDGISVYDLGRESGKVTKHSIEKLVMNNKPLDTRKGIWNAVTEINGEGIPVLGLGGTSGASIGMHETPTMLKMSATSSSTSSNGDFDTEAFDRKNASRKNFGLGPITPEEFLRIQEEVRIMEQEARSSRATQEVTKRAPKNKGGNFLSKILGDVMEDTCESNYDCQRPQVCCDLVVRKVCCSTGLYVGQSIPHAIPIPVPAAVDNYPDDTGRM